MATVWVRERGDMFCRGLIPNTIAWQETTEQSGTVAEVIHAVAALDEEAREAVSRGKLGWDSNGLQFEGFFAPKSMLDRIALPMRQIGKIKVAPKVEAETKAFFGKEVFPLNGRNAEAFLVQVNSAAN